MDAPSSHGSPAALHQKTARAIALALALGISAPLIPGLESYDWVPADATTLLPRVFRPTTAAPPTPELPAEVDDDVLVAMGPSTDTSAPVVSPEQAAAALELGRVADDDLEEAIGMVVDSQLDLPPHPERLTLQTGLALLPIEDPQHGLRRFYFALDRVAQRRPGAVARVVHYGDSLITGDYVTSTVRRLLQKKFGDAGHGFVLAGHPSKWYRRNQMRLTNSEGWGVNRLTKPTIKDGAYGLGGATFRSKKRGQWVKLRPRGKELIGANVSKMQVFYLAQPYGGKFELTIDGRGVTVDTNRAETASRTAEIQVADGRHELKVRTLGGGEVRLFGVVMERDGPGVVYDSLGIDGARAKLLKRMDPPHWHEQLRLRKPDLLVLHYGTNETQWRNLSSSRYHADLAQTVGHLRQALPGVSCLLIGPMDRAERNDSGRLVTRPVVKRIVNVQRRVAYEQGCAFWNAYLAMGGEGSVVRWYKARPQLASSDLTHPTKKGANRLGAMFFAALMDGYSAAKGP